MSLHRFRIKTRKLTILIHRWMGIIFCLPFLLWFLSGIVMMYTEYPVLNTDVNAKHMPAIDFAAITLTPGDALRAVGVDTADKFTVSSLEGRPAYRIWSKGASSTIFADSGQRFSPPEDEEAKRIATAWINLPLQDAASQGVLLREDQWTVTSKYRSYRPLHKYNWPNGESVYVSSVTGEVVQHTTRQERIGAYFGAIPHWIYITQLRKDAARWNKVVISASALGSAMTLFGLIAGVWFYSPRRRYRHNGTSSSIPFQGNKRWHVLIGLGFGLLTFTWILSGMFSMSILQSKPDPLVGKARRATYEQAWTQEEWQLADLHVFLGRDIREVELVRSLQQPGYLVYDALGHASLFSTDGTPNSPTKTQIESAFSSAVRPGHIITSRIVTEYELYYIDRRHQKPLPALYLETDTPKTSVFYLDLSTGRIIQTYGTMARWNRWLYHGLHSWDLPWLYRHRPLWDIGMIIAMVVGTMLSWTGLFIGFARGRATLRKIKKRFTRTA